MKLSAAQAAGVSARLEDALAALAAAHPSVARHNVVLTVFERSTGVPFGHLSADGWRAPCGRPADQDFFKRHAPDVLQAAVTACMGGDSAHFHVMPQMLQRAEADTTSHAAQIRALGESAGDRQRRLGTLIASMRTSMDQAKALTERKESTDAPFLALEQTTREAATLVQEILQLSRRRSDGSAHDASVDGNNASPLHRSGEDVANVAHHLNNLFAAVQAGARLKLKGSAKVDLALIEVAVTDAASTVNRIAELSGPSGETGWQDLDLGTLAAGAHALLLSRADGAVALELDIGDTLPVRGNAAELREAIFNLASNALDAVGKAGWVVIRATQKDGAPCVVIEDNGPGMSAELQARIFEPFFSTKGEGGNGLGLPLCQRIVKTHGARLECDSVPGRGTSFSIVFA